VEVSKHFIYDITIQEQITLVDDIIKTAVVACLSMMCISKQLLGQNFVLSALLRKPS